MSKFSLDDVEELVRLAKEAIEADPTLRPLLEAIIDEIRNFEGTKFIISPALHHRLIDEMPWDLPFYRFMNQMRERMNNN